MNRIERIQDLRSKLEDIASTSNIPDVVEAANFGLNMLQGNRDQVIADLYSKIRSNGVNTRERVFFTYLLILSVV